MTVVELGELFNNEHAWWQPEAVWKSQWADLESGGALLIDDTVNSKENTTRTEGAHPTYSGCAKRVVKGQTFLAALYVAPEGGVRLIWMEMWQPDGPGKLALARQLVEHLLAAGIRPDEVSFDAWYADAAFLQWLSKQGLRWTTRMRKSRRFYFPSGTEQSLKEWGKQVPISSCHFYRREGLYAKAVPVANQEIWNAKVVLMRAAHRWTPEEEVYLLTNDRQATVRQVINRYRRRWKIEVAFRACKQSLGFSGYRHLTAIGAERHVALVGLLYNYLSGQARASGLTLGGLKRIVLNSMATNTLPYETLRMAA